MTLTRYPLLLACLCLGWLSGCGGPSNELGRLPVSGDVTFGGKPLDHGSIEFMPTGEGTQSGAPIENGHYSISENQGLPPGEYLVRIYSAADTGGAAEELPGESSELAEERIPAEFNTESKQKVTVDAGNEENKFDFDIPESKS